MISKNNYEVILINPPSFKGKIRRRDFFTPPMGLAYLASVLLKKNIAVKIIDCDPMGIFINPIDPKEYQIKALYNELKKINNSVLLIGIGPCTTPNLHNNLVIADYSKRFFKNSVVAMGGPHPSLIPPNMANRMIKEYSFIDIVAIGEGEETICEIVSALKTKRSIERIPGIIYRKQDGTPSEFISRTPIKNLDTIPFPTRELLKDYFPKYRVALRKSLVSRYDTDHNIKKTSRFQIGIIFSSRGCPYRCAFCCSSKIRRIRTAKNVIEEIEECIKKYNVFYFIFYDDLFTTASQNEKQRIKEICQLIEEKKLNIIWSVELRADVICNLGEELLTKMNKAGCRYVNIGIEKGYQRALDYLQKDLKINEIENAINILRKSGDFIINGTFIFGGNEETKEEAKQTIIFAKKLKLDYAAFYSLEIHSGNDLFNKAKKAGIVLDFWNPYKLNHEYPLFTTNELSKDDLTNLQKCAYRDFYFNMYYLKNRIRNIKSVSDLTMNIKEYIHWTEHTLFGIR